MTGLMARLKRRNTEALSRFKRSEDGTLAIFALFLFMLMIMMGGVAVDLMRYESTRTSLQYTLDRATLAAASLSQSLDSEEVVRDYFAKAGLSNFLTGVNVSEGINYREVVADARAETDPKFVHLIGIDNLEAPGHSKAEQRMNNVEIVLVLDVSGSMGSNNRLVNLKAAAKEFVQTVLSSDAENRISISLVPFSENVNLPLALRQKYNATAVPYGTGKVNYNCLQLPDSTYSQTGISRTTPIPMIPVMDSTGSTNRINGYVNMTDSTYGRPNSGNFSCTARSGVNTLVLPSQDIAALKTRIDNLQDDGTTSINIGMKWGMAMLDPGTKSIFEELAAAGQMHTRLAVRPYEFTDPESMKVIVLMTDGENTAADLVSDTYKQGTSPIFKSPNDGYYSIRFTTGRPGSAGTREYWVPHRSEWRTKAWTNTSDTGTAIPVPWEEVWDNAKLTWVAWQLFARAIGTNDSQRNSQYTYWYAQFSGSTYIAPGQMYTRTSVSTMNTQLQTICNLAKANGVTVYGIAFEAPTAGRTAISNCATSSAHYFNASGLQIKSAFNTIANNISHLRLTQ